MPQTAPKPEEARSGPSGTVFRGLRFSLRRSFGESQKKSAPNDKAGDADEDSRRRAEVVQHGIRSAFAMFDADGDGSSEFQRAPIDTTACQLLELCSNPSLAVTKAEFVAALTRQTGEKAESHALTLAQAEMLFAEADVDGNGVIDLSEFGEAWLEYDAQYGMTKMIAARKKGQRRRRSIISFIGSNAKMHANKPHRKQTAEGIDIGW